MVVMRTIEDKIARGKAHTAAKAEVRRGGRSNARAMQRAYT